MKAVRLRASTSSSGAHLEVTEEARPRAGRGEIVVRIRACGLNVRDKFMLDGIAPFEDQRIPLSDAAGEVFEVGEEVDEFQVGDAVVSVFYPYWTGGPMTPGTRRDIPGEALDGYAREWVSAPACAFMKAPPGLTPVEAATLPCTGVTAWRALLAANLSGGQTVLTQGTGSLSLFALQLAKAAGARVIAISSTSEKLRRLAELGADETIDRSLHPDWASEVRELTGGQGVDHVVDVGGPSTLPQSLNACRVGGHVAVAGVLGGFSVELFVPAIFSKEIRLTGLSIGSRADQEALMRAVAVNGIRPVVDRCFPLERLSEAYAYLSEPNRFGKVCIEL